MKIGLLYEGDFDEKPLQVIILNIIQEINPQIRNIKFIAKPAEGSIDGVIRIASVLFYDTNECDIAVFVADSDGKDDKQKRIKALVKRHCKKIKPDSINIVGCPDPVLEQWFLDEENAIRQLFSLPGSVELPYSKMPPKERLERIINENNKDITTTPREIYIKVAEMMDFGKLYRSSRSFQNFYM
jgi:hypothetical protein